MSRLPAGRIGPYRRVASLFAVLFATANVGQAEAQVLPAALGTIGGFAAGTYTTIGIYVAQARAGKYLYSPEEALSPRIEVVPMVAGPLTGLLLGLESTERLESAGLWGSVGLAAGTVAGIPVGRLLWGPNEGVWAGGIIGGAVGLVAGIVAGATMDPGPPEPGRESAGLSLPVGLSVRF